VCPKNTGRANVCMPRACERNGRVCVRSRWMRACACIRVHTRVDARDRADASGNYQRLCLPSPEASDDLRDPSTFHTREHFPLELSRITLKLQFHLDELHATDFVSRVLHHRTRCVESMCTRAVARVARVPVWLEYCSFIDRYAGKAFNRRRLHNFS